MNQTPSTDTYSPIATLAQFDMRSGNILERLLFNRRTVLVVLCALLTLVLGTQAFGLRLNASFAKTIPTHHPFVANYLNNEGELKGLANALRIAVEMEGEGNLYNAHYLEVLRDINDEVYLIPGVDRP